MVSVGACSPALAFQTEPEASRPPGSLLEAQSVRPTLGILKQQVDGRRGLQSSVGQESVTLSPPPPSLHQPQTSSSLVSSLIFPPLQVPSALQDSSGDI